MSAWGQAGGTRNRLTLKRQPSGIGIAGWGYEYAAQAARGAGTGVTYHQVRLAEAPFNAMQLLILNSNNGGVWACGGAAVAAANSIAAAANQNNTSQTGDSGWQVCTVGGAAPPWNVPAATLIGQSLGGLPAGTSNGRIPGMIITDKIRVRSVAPANTTNNPLSKHISMYRILQPSSEANFNYLPTGIKANATQWQTDVGTGIGHFWRAFNQNTDFVNSNQGSFSTTSDGDFPAAVIPVYYYDVRGMSILAPGDSIGAGNLTTSGTNAYYWANVAAALQSAQTFPIDVINIAAPSMTSAQFVTAAKAWIARLVALGAPLPDICIIPGGSPNDNFSTAAGTDRGWYQVVDLYNYCVANQITPILCTPTPQNSSSAHPTTVDTQIDILAARIRAQGANVFDVLAAMGKPSGGYITGYGAQADGNNEVHPGDTGMAALASAFRGVLASIIAAN